MSVCPSVSHTFPKKLEFQPPAPKKKMKKKMKFQKTLLGSTLLIACVCLSHFSKEIGIRKKKKMEFAKKNGICTGFWIFGGRRPAAEGRSQSIEITLTT